jgi:hypothetical protein
MSLNARAGFGGGIGRDSPAGDGRIASEFPGLGGGIAIERSGAPGSTRTSAPDLGGGIVGLAPCALAFDKDMGVE